MAYRVRLGGSPKDSGVVVGTYSEAEDMAISMAKGRAVAVGDDADSVAIYGDVGRAPWGACPMGDEGGYYPVITVED